MNDQAETLESLRQALMRYRELLDILHIQLDEGEDAYAALLARLDPQDIAGLSQKEVLGLVAQTLLDDPSALSKAAIAMRFHMRNLERDFEQVYDNVMVL